MTVLRTRDIMRLALERGEITSSDVVSHLVKEPISPREYRSLLAQASTLLGRLHTREELERRWIQRNRGCYLYMPSEKAVDSLLPFLSVLEERKRRKEIEEVLTAFVKRIILELRLENQVTAVLWDPTSQDQADKIPSTKVWVIAQSQESKNVVVKEAERLSRNVVRIKPIFLQAQGDSKDIWEKVPQHASILYGWSQIPPR